MSTPLPVSSRSVVALLCTQDFLCRSAAPFSPHSSHLFTGLLCGLLWSGSRSTDYPDVKIHWVFNRHSSIKEEGKEGGRKEGRKEGKEGGKKRDIPVIQSNHYMSIFIVIYFWKPNVSALCRNLYKLKERSKHTHTHRKQGRRISCSQ